MAFFKPMWERKTDVIIKFIYRANIRRTNDLRNLSDIILYCSTPDVRAKAIKKLPDGDIKVSIMLKARKNGNLEVVKAIIDSWNYNNCSVCCSPLFAAAQGADDPELLSLLALKVKTLKEWEDHWDVFNPLLENPGHDKLVSHHNELKKIDDEEKKAIAQQKREEAKKKRYDAFLLHPKEELTKAAGKRSEKKLWQEWYDYQLKKTPNNILYELTGELKNLNWAAFFPEGAVKSTALRGELYVVDYLDCSFDTAKAKNDLRFFLGSLYDQREDMRKEILSLNGELFYAGRKGGSRYALNLSTNVDDDYMISWDSIPPYKLSVFLAGKELQISLDEVHND